MKHTDDRYAPILAANRIYGDTYVSFLEKYSPNEEERLYVSVFAPTAIEYVRWVLADSMKKGIKRLYFLARDAYSMYVVADMMCRHFNIDIDCRYLCISRYSVRIPEYHLIGEQCIDRICIGGIDVTFRKMLMRAGLCADDIDMAAKVCGYEGKCDEILNYSQINALKDVLKSDKGLLKKIYDISKQEYDNAVAYFKQEGLLDDVEYALVDSGWIGTLQQSLRNILKSAGRKRNLLGYYFGMYELPKGENINSYRSFYFSPNKGLRRKVLFSNCLFEFVFSAPFGMTLRYEKSEVGYVPIYSSDENANASSVRNHIESLKNYTVLWLTKVQNIYEDTDYEMLERLLGMCMALPSVIEAQILGSGKFSDDVLEHSMKTVAARLTQEDIKNQRLLNRLMIVSGMKKKVIRESAWIEGSIVLNGTNVKKNLRHVRIYKYFVYLRKQLKRG